MPTSMKKGYLGNLPVGATILYLCPSSVLYSRIISCTINNISTVPVALTMYKVESGGSVILYRTIYLTESISAGEPRTLHEMIGQVLETGDLIYGNASIINSLILTLDVVETTL